MYSPSKKLKPPKQFKFPFPPYDIQLNLMQQLYQVVEDKCIGIFESPTGTGKSLTLTCGALHWLEDYEKLIHEDLEQNIKKLEQNIQLLEIDNMKTVDWITHTYEINQKRLELKNLLQLNESLEEFNRGLEKLYERQNRKRKMSYMSTTDVYSNNKEGDESGICGTKLEKKLRGILEPTSLIDCDETSSRDEWQNTKIFFCSRTHSQLAQVVREVKRTAYGKRIRCVTLGSRQHYCINNNVRRLNSVALINEQCLNLSQKSSKKKTIFKDEDEELMTEKEIIVKNKNSCGCPFKSNNNVQKLSETILTEIYDIEDLVKEGSKQKGCPYYAARNAATSAAQLIMLPYQMVLHQRTRKLSGIDIRGSVIIIDEAHNLLDTIAKLHSCEINLCQLLEIKDALVGYKFRYIKLLSAPNLLKINQLLYIVKNLIKLLEYENRPLCPANASFSSFSLKSRILRTFELSFEGDFFNIDIAELLLFCERTHFAQKLRGFNKNDKSKSIPSKENEVPENKQHITTISMLQRLQQENNESCNKKKEKKVDEHEITVGSAFESKTEVESSSVSLHVLLAFLETLMENADDGRIIIQIDGTSTGSMFKYTVLNPGKYFEYVIRESRSVIIAGGTMKPTNDLMEQLFINHSGRVRQHFFDHVVPANAVLPFVIQKGPTGKTLCFNYKQRLNGDMLSELSMIFQNLCNVVPGGIVCFFTSYDYLQKVCDHMQKILEKINLKKHVFREPRAFAVGEQSVEKMMKDYEETIRTKGGALLLSVVGGKLSEGLNFKDNLCRAVIVVGMPYANSQSVELQERLKYLDNVKVGSGNEYYENLCMKAVNQCIGRSVRHINDYAAVYLIDERYAHDHICNKLPQWIGRSLDVSSPFGSIQATTARFFKNRQD